MHRVSWWKTWACVGLLSVLVWGQIGCVAVLSTQVRQQADRSITFGHLRTMPEAYIGRTVILGGDIVRVWNVPGATWLDVVQRPLDAADQPILTARSEGRFVVRCDRYLNPLLYTAGRVVTIAGRVLGTHTDTLGEHVEVSPLLTCVDIYLWPQATVTEGHPSLWLWWEWDPWYWHPWYWHPWSWRPHHPHLRRRPYHHHRR
jgi:outer membrane lipoprotein